MACWSSPAWARPNISVSFEPHIASPHSTGPVEIVEPVWAAPPSQEPLIAAQLADTGEQAHGAPTDPRIHYGPSEQAPPSAAGDPHPTSAPVAGAPTATSVAGFIDSLKLPLQEPLIKTPPRTRLSRIVDDD